MLKLITENGTKTELVPVGQLLVRTFPLRCKKEQYVVIYPDGYLAVFQPPEK